MAAINKNLVPIASFSPMLFVIYSENERSIVASGVKLSYETTLPLIYLRRYVEIVITIGSPTS